MREQAREAAAGLVRPQRGAGERHGDGAPGEEPGGRFGLPGRSACVAGMDGEVAARVCRELAEHLVVASEESGGGGGGGGGGSGGRRGGRMGTRPKSRGSGRGRRATGAGWSAGSSLATSLLEGGRRGQALLLGAVEGLDASLGGPGLVRLHAAAPTPRREGRGHRPVLPAPSGGLCWSVQHACVSNAFGAPLAGEEEEPGATPPQLTEESAESLRALCRWGRAGDVLRRRPGGIRRASVATTSATTSASGTPGAKRVCRRVEEEEVGG